MIFHELLNIFKVSCCQETTNHWSHTRKLSSWNNNHKPSTLLILSASTARKNISYVCKSQRLRNHMALNIQLALRLSVQLKICISYRTSLDLRRLLAVGGNATEQPIPFAPVMPWIVPYSGESYRSASAIRHT